MPGSAGCLCPWRACVCGLSVSVACLRLWLVCVRGVSASVACLCPWRVCVCGYLRPWLVCACCRSRRRYQQARAVSAAPSRTLTASVGFFTLASDLGVSMATVGYLLGLEPAATPTTSVTAMAALKSGDRLLDATGLSGGLVTVDASALERADVGLGFAPLMASDELIPETPTEVMSLEHIEVRSARRFNVVELRRSR